MTTPELRVWDPLVRLFHWSLVAGVVLAWATSETGRDMHEPVGWFVLALLGLRLAWGLVGPRYARFSQFVPGPRSVLRYAAQVLRGRAPRYLGHNPLGALMVLALLADLLATGASGWLMTTDAFFGSEALEEVHEALAAALAPLVALHVAGVLVTGRHQRENLVRAMLTGRKRAPQPGDVH